jgi:hypothetical protein
MSSDFLLVDIIVFLYIITYVDLNKEQMMKVKVRDSKYAKRELYGFNIAEYYFVEGTQIETPKWVDYPAMTIRTGSGKYDFRIIDAANIVEIDYIAYTQPVSTPKFKTVDVRGSKGDIYKVTIGDKHSSCTCHAFMFRKSCKHIREAIAA